MNETPPPKRSLWQLLLIVLFAAVGPCSVLMATWAAGFVAIRVKQWSPEMVRLELAYLSLLAAGLMMCHTAFVSGGRNPARLALVSLVAIGFFGAFQLLFPGPIPLE